MQPGHELYAGAEQLLVELGLTVVDDLREIVTGRERGPAPFDHEYRRLTHRDLVERALTSAGEDDGPRIGRARRQLSQLYAVAGELRHKGRGGERGGQPEVPQGRPARALSACWTA